MSQARSNAQKLSQLASKHVPELQKVLGELGTLDARSREELMEIDKLVRSMMDAVSGSNPMDGNAPAAIQAAAKQHLEQYIRLHTQMADLGHDVYQVVENQVQRVDGAIAEADAKILQLSQRIEDLTPQAVTDSAAVGTRGTTARATAKRGRTSKADLEQAAAAAAAMLPPGPVAPAPVIPPHFKLFEFHLPGREPFSEYVDPMEPKYCVCQQPSQGNMIGCDGDDCKHEWFHWPCVGITEEQTGSWYCEQCKAKLKK